MLDVVKLRVEGNEGVGMWLEMYRRLWSQVGKLWLVLEIRGEREYEAPAI